MIRISRVRDPFPLITFVCPNCTTHIDSDEYVRRTITDYNPQPRRQNVFFKASTYLVERCPVCKGQIWCEYKPTEDAR